MADTPEAVAFALMERIASVEGRTFNKGASGIPADREWLIRTYHQCRTVVSGTMPPKAIVELYEPGQ